MKLSRRQLIVRAAAASGLLLSPWQRTLADASDRILVVVELSGGNDGFARH